VDGSTLEELLTMMQGHLGQIMTSCSGTENASSA